jgi:hypothetical protein
VRAFAILAALALAAWAGYALYERRLPGVPDEAPSKAAASRIAAAQPQAADCIDAGARRHAQPDGLGALADQLTAGEELTRCLEGAPDGAALCSGVMEGGVMPACDPMASGAHCAAFISVVAAVCAGLEARDYSALGDPVPDLEAVYSPDDDAAGSAEAEATPGSAHDIEAIRRGDFIDETRDGSGAWE